MASTTAGARPDSPGRLGVVLSSTLDPDCFGDGLTPETVRVTGARGALVEVPLLVSAEGLVVLQRHRSGSRVPAHLVDHHANVRALAAAGCARVLGLCSVGSLRRNLPVGSVLVPDDVLALGIAPTYFDDTRGHRVPGFDAAWSADVLAHWQAASATGAGPIAGGTYAHVSGPRFETPAEIRLLATFADVVGMTMAAELFLCGELDLAYAGACSIDNLANGLDSSALAVEQFQQQARENAKRFGATAAATATALLAVR